MTLVILSRFLLVTTHTGGVDWNRISKLHKFCEHKSPPTRVVWIEIFIQSLVTDNKAVTTHTGGVDWNTYQGGKYARYKQSPPTRVVWIEIAIAFNSLINLSLVTTHTGGVDWNLILMPVLQIQKRSPPTRVVWIEITHITQGVAQWWGHHPHGWCGLKSSWTVSIILPPLVTTHTGGVDWN